jgi:hypothetical protein
LAPESQFFPLPEIYFNLSQHQQQKDNCVQLQMPNRIICIDIVFPQLPNEKEGEKRNKIGNKNNHFFER